MIKTTRQVAEDILKHQYFLLKLIQPARTPVVQAINSLPQGAGQLHITFFLCDVAAVFSPRCGVARATARE
jgi:hypothetical protein